MKVRSSEMEISLEASREQFSTFHSTIQDFILSSKIHLTIELESNYDPKPYKLVHTKIILRKGKVSSIIVDNQNLILEGSEGFLNSLSVNLPVEVESIPYHVHYDWVSFPQFLTGGTPELVLEAIS